MLQACLALDWSAADLVVMSNPVVRKSLTDFKSSELR